MKIIEICPFSAGICGVWSRVILESMEFEKLGHNITIFSSNIEKGTNKEVCLEDKIGNIKIRRFLGKKNKFSDNVIDFNFESELKELNPDIVITHLFHPHSFKALKICNKLNIPCYLVTHAPFNVKRKFPLNLITKIFFYILIERKINNFTKIISITKWEKPYLLKLGIPENKIIYIPNGLPTEFFTQKPLKKEKSNNVLFLGRISQVKDIETLIFTANLLPEINFSVVGTYEDEYRDKLIKIINDKKIKNVNFYPPVYNIKEKIKIIDNHQIFVLPSIREAMPQVIIEALSRGKIVISSETDGGKELISNGKDGFLFPIGDYKSLSSLIKANIQGNKNIENNAKKSSLKYSWKNLIKLYITIFNKNDIHNNHSI